MRLADASFLVAGVGRTGTAVCEVLRARGARVTTVAASGADLLDDTDWAAHDFSYDAVVASPGFPPHASVLAAARAAGVEIYSEIEVAWRLRARRADGSFAPWLVVTGTNGKTTTVGMTAAILRAGGLKVAAVGNVGVPAVSTVIDPSWDALVVELSSFQLHYTYSLAPAAAVCLNLAPDHLDWHGGVAAYRDAKARVYERTRVACLYPAGAPEIERMVAQADVHEGAIAVPFTLGAPPRQGLGMVDDLLVDRAFGPWPGAPFASAHELASTADLAHLSGGTLHPHLLTNALAAAGLARALGVAAPAVAAGLRSFTLDPHRLATVARVGQVDYVDDSKATNTHAAQAALQSFPPGSVVWIAGGLAKGAHFDELLAQVGERLAAVVLIGREQGELATALRRHAPNIPVKGIDPADTEVMRSAVHAAASLARPGQVVLLAPACASQDQFANYGARGDAFAAAVRQLP